MFCKIYHHFQMQSAVWLWKVTSATTIAYHQRTIITFLDPSLMLQFNQGPHNHNIRKELQYSISRWTLAPSLLLSENEGHYHPTLTVLPCFRNLLILDWFMLETFWSQKFQFIQAQIVKSYANNIILYPSQLY